ncbi:MAG: 5'-phosphate synthase pdxT subunit [Hyphomicrobiaceae bacterium]
MTVTNNAQERSTPLVGVLALQGDFALHQAALAACGLRTRQLRTAGQLRDVDALVLPGGESTTMLKLLEVEKLWGPLGEALQRGIPIMATCAGLILLSEHVENPAQKSYGVLPLTVVRNGYGRQFHSGTFDLVSDVLPKGTAGTFIRAPRISALHGEVEVLARRGDDPVLVRRGHVLAACFHPELAVGHPVTSMFAQMVRAHASASDSAVAAQ